MSIAASFKKALSHILAGYFRKGRKQDGTQHRIHIELKIARGRCGHDALNKLHYGHLKVHPVSDNALSFSTFIYRTGKDVYAHVLADFSLRGIRPVCIMVCSRASAPE